MTALRPGAGDKWGPRFPFATSPAFVDVHAMLKAIAACCLAIGLTLTATSEDLLLYELRTYHAEPGKLDALLTRFRDHTCKLFEKHGMTNVGYWVPVENKDNLLIYLLSYPDRAARDKAWKAFGSDPEWKKAATASEVDGKLVGNIDELYLASTDFSPGFPGPANAGPERVFEMRTYTTRDGLLPALHQRFREHTIELFKKHGMTNLGYFKLTPGQPAEENSLLYFLAHRDKAAADKSWAEFRADPVWVAAKKASEDANGGSLTVLPDGVKSVFLKPVDFSPLK